MMLYEALAETIAQIDRVMVAIAIMAAILGAFIATAWWIASDVSRIADYDREDEG